jgi:hypothetical protein
MAAVCLALWENAAARERANALRGAERAAHAAWRHAERLDLTGRAEAARYMGTLAWLQGKRAEADHWWARSVALAEQMGMRYELARTLYEQGVRLEERAPLARATAIFTDIGADWDLACVRALAPDLVPQGSPPATDATLG